MESANLCSGISIFPSFVGIIALLLSEFTRVIKGAAVRTSKLSHSCSVGRVSILNVTPIDPVCTRLRQIFDLLEIHSLKGIKFILIVKAMIVWILIILEAVEGKLAGHGCTLELT